jgi:hypothetical protein
MVTYRESEADLSLFRNILTSYSGVASYQQIIEATAEGFNMERNLSAALTAFGMVCPLDL